MRGVATPPRVTMLPRVTTSPRMVRGGTRMDNAGSDLAGLGPCTLALAKAGATHPVPKRPSTAIAGSQKIRSLMARSLGSLALETVRPTPMAPDLAKTSAWSFAGRPFRSRITRIRAPGSLKV